jgi:hypothetical protein
MVGMILLKPQGTVADVWLVSGFVFNPPWLEFQEAYLDYLRRWQYEMPESSPPVCDGSRDQRRLPLSEIGSEIEVAFTRGTITGKVFVLTVKEVDVPQP